MGTGEDDIFQIKKVKFLEYVKSAANALGVSPPEVNFGHCPDTRNEQAHIHLDAYLICIYKGRLMQMNDYDMQNTATHEVAHLASPTHDSEFQKKHAFIHLGSWKPPPGVIVVHGGKIPDYRKLAKKYVKPLIITTECNYHSCEVRTNLQVCKHCNHYFCNKHLRAKEPGMPRFQSSTKDSIIFMEEWRRAGGHPCGSYLDYLEQRKEKTTKRYLRVLDWLREAKPIVIPKTKPKEEYVVHKDVYGLRYYTKKKNEKMLIVAVTLFVLVIASFSVYNYVKDNPEKFPFLFSFFGSPEQTVKQHFNAYSIGDRNAFIETLDSENMAFYNDMLTQFDTITAKAGPQVGYKRELSELKVIEKTNSTARVYVKYTDTLPPDQLMPKTVTYVEEANMTLLLKNGKWRISEITE